MSSDSPSHQSCEYSRTMRSPYDFATATTDNEESKPYHARENSLPFSYGNINKTSTPIKNGTSAGGGGGMYRNYEYSTSATNTNFNLNSVDRGGYNNNTYDGSGSGNGYNSATANATTLGNGTDANMIKTQPRLTSPLLVRKTLNSRSPTRLNTTNTNTIANTYHYNNGLNGSQNDYTTTLRKTPTRRDDFEELLRERREKVYNEYRSNNTQNQQQHQLSINREPPQPPQRQHHLLTSAPISRYTNGNSGQNQHYSNPSHRKYNYDFEFHLNLDDDWLPPRRANTMDRSSLQQYQTRNIPLPTTATAATATAAAVPTASESTYVERNYHTISSSNPIRETSMMMYAANKPQQQQRERPPLEATTSMLTTTSTAYNRGFQSQPQQQQQQPQSQQQNLRPGGYAASTYGNENASSYGGGVGDVVDYVKSTEEYRSKRSLLGETARNRSDFTMTTSSPLSPIYATTTKQVANRSINTNTTTYRNATTAVNEPELSITDYIPSSATSTLVSRPETPAFPVTPRTPYGANNGYNTPNMYPNSPQSQRLERANGHFNDVQQNYSTENIYQTNYRSRLNSNISMINNEPQEVAAHLVKFAKDSSKFWYKPNLSREEAISQLLNAAPGTFIVRDSTTYKNSYGLVLRVAQPPPGSSSGKLDELVRHFLIEPTTRGVRLKGCANEPVFTSLSALIYEHSINQLSLPCLLRIPESDLIPSLMEPTPAQEQLLTQGAACNVLWLFSCETESLTGEEAIRKAIRQLYAQKPMPAPTEVHFKVTQQGITLTDNTRKKFFRKHYAADIISYCDIDPDHRLWTMQAEGAASDDRNSAHAGLKKTIFAFVARRSPGSKDNQCHVFCDLAINQPASAIVSFANKTLPTEKHRNYVL